MLLLVFIGILNRCLFIELDGQSVSSALVPVEANETYINARSNMQNGGFIPAETLIQNSQVVVFISLHFSNILCCWIYQQVLVFNNYLLLILLYYWYTYLPGLLILVVMKGNANLPHFMQCLQKLQDAVEMLGMQIKQHEDNLNHLNTQKTKLDYSILGLQGTFKITFEGIFYLYLSPWWWMR